MAEGARALKGFLSGTDGLWIPGQGIFYLLHLLAIRLHLRREQREEKKEYGDNPQVCS
jgi:hypothetical protein